MCSTGVPEKRASISPPIAFAAPGPVEEKITPKPPETRASPSAMCAPPSSPRAMTKRMALRRPIASSIGMLCTEAMPNAVVTPHCVRNSATRSPTV